jgi:rhomboid protease GluP
MSDDAQRRFVPWVTISFALANVAVFAWEIAAGADPVKPTAQWMIAHGGNFGPITLGGEPWRLVTSMFLHYGILHIVMNMIGLLDGGRHVEKMYGRAGYVVLYLVSGLAAGLASGLRSNTASAGASGAIFGVFGAFGAFLFVHRDRLDRDAVAKQSRGLMIFLAYNLFYGATQKGIDLTAHIGGLIVGFACGLALELGTDHRPSTVRRSIAVAVFGLVLVFAGTKVLPRPVGLLEEYGKTETEVLAKWNEAVPKLKSGEMTGDQAADLIQLEILPAWHAMRVDYEAHAHPSGEDFLDEYFKAREDGWTTMAIGWREKNEDTTQRGLARFKEADAIIKRMTDAK